MVMYQEKKKYVDIIAVAVLSFNVDVCVCIVVGCLFDYFSLLLKKKSASVSPVKISFLNNTFLVSNVLDDRSSERQRRGRTQRRN